MTVTRLIGLLDPETGFIPQSPELAATLPLIDGYITEQDRLHAAKDWRDFCRCGYRDLIELDQKLAELNIGTTRDSYLPILPILDSLQPLDYLTRMAAKLGENMPSREFAPRDYAVRLRDRVLVEFEIETGLRAKNMADMTWSDDGSGHLKRLGNGHFKIEIPYKNFKNWRGPFFGPMKNKHNYEKELDPALTTLIEEYLLARALLLGSNVCNKVFVTWRSDAKGGTGFTPDGLSTRWRRLTIEYLAYDPISKTGILGVYPFGLHAARHIIATHHLKLSGSFRDAADAIHDSEEIVESCYGRFLPRDRHERIKSVSRESRRRAGGATGELIAA
jgi:integrase